MRSGDLDGVVTCFAPDVVWEALVPDSECRNRDDVRAMLEASIGGRVGVHGLEIAGGHEHVALGIRSPQLDELAGVKL